MSEPRAARAVVPRWTGRRLLAAAALLHVLVTLALFGVGRVGLSPAHVDRDGVLLTSDSQLYRREAVQLVETWRTRGTRAWMREGARTHVRALSVAFALLAPALGTGIVAAEPVNLVYYVAIVALVLAIGTEIGGRRAGLVAAGAVALWPTFLLHTTQLLKDPPFIAGALALALVVTTWLTRALDRRGAVRVAAVAAIAATLLLSIRPKFAPVIVALLLLGLALLLVRQVVERRVLRWNLACAVGVCGAAVIAFVVASRPIERRKAYPSPPRGPLKSVAGVGAPRRALVAWRPATISARPGDAAARALGSVRARYDLTNRGAGSGIDAGVQLARAADVVRYLPRAAQIGLWAPFPRMWLDGGHAVGTVGRLVAGLETAVIYLCQPLAIVAVAFGRRRLPALLLAGITLLAVTVMGLVVSNVGTLYRFRYPFWILLVILGATGLEVVRTRRWAR